MMPTYREPTQRPLFDAAYCIDCATYLPDTATPQTPVMWLGPGMLRCHACSQPKRIWQTPLPKMRPESELKVLEIGTDLEHYISLSTTSPPHTCTGAGQGE